MSARNGTRLPALARLLLRLATPPRHRDALEEELAGELTRVRRGGGRLAAMVFLARELAGVIGHGAGDRLSPSAGGVRLLGGIGADVRVAARRLRASPGFTLVAALTLALALFITSGAFGLADALFLRPLPYHEPHRLVAVWETERDDLEITTVSPPNAHDWQRESRTLADVAWFNSMGATLTAPGEAVRLAGSVATVNLFRVLGVRPALGPGFQPEHARPDTAAPARVAVLSHGLWLRQFGADPGVIGRSIELNDVPHEVVGVMPPEFRHPRTFMGAEPAELWVPIATGPSGEDRDIRYLHVVARLASGATVAEAQAELASIGEALARRYPDANGGRAVVVRPVQEQIFGAQRPIAALLLAAAALVLLVACVNMANLLLARGLARGREFAVRAALGSGRVVLVRQLLLEALLLALLGGSLGVAFLVAGEGVLRAALGAYINPLAELRMDIRVILFTMAAAVGSGLLFGALPALRLSASDPRSALTVRGGHGGARLRGWLVAAEAGLTVVLVFGAGLLGRSLLRVLQVSPGFAVERTVFFEVRPPYTGYQDQGAVLAFYDRLRGALEAHPEIERAALLSDLPLTSENRGMTFTVPASDRPDDERSAEFHTVSPGYFATAGIRLLEGRDFTEADTREVPWVAIVNRAAARRYWGERSPVGEVFRSTQAGLDVQVIAVVESTVDDALHAPFEPRVYFATGQNGVRALYVLARTRGPAERALPAVRPIVAALDPRVPVAELSTMERHVAASMSVPRGLAWLAALFGGMALLLAAVGIYGVVAHGVTERTGELGVRAALGARRSRLVALVIRDSAGVTLFGVTAGVAVALVAGRALSSQLHHVRPWDPAALLATVTIVGLASLLAAWLPARRAARVDPMVAMRAE